MLKTEN